MLNSSHGVYILLDLWRPYRQKMTSEKQPRRALSQRKMSSMLCRATWVEGFGFWLGLRV